MKNTLLITLLFLFSGISNAQLNFLNNQAVQVSSYITTHAGTCKLFSDTSIINANGTKLDLLQCAFVVDDINNYYTQHADATYRLNVGSTNFEGGVNIFNVGGSGINSVKGVQFFKLNTASSRNDAVIWRDLGFDVYTNTTSGISTTVHQSILAGTFSFQNTAKGSFVYDNTLNQYKLEDLITYGTDNLGAYYFQVYKNLGDGSFASNPISIRKTQQNYTVFTKMISAQIDFPISPYAEYNYPNQINKNDIIASDNHHIYIFLNNNSNGINTTPTTTITKNYTISDFTVCDINNDGYNELIIAGYGDPIEIHNSTHYTIHNDPAFTFTNSAIEAQHLTTGDFDKDGWNDLVVGHQVGVKIFRNQYSTNPTAMFSSSSCQTITAWPFLATKLIVADLNNLGGLSLLVSGLPAVLWNSEEDENEDPNCMLEGQTRLNPSTQYSDPPPAPPIALWYYYEDGTVYRPKILINNHGEKDFNNYQIWKYKTGWNDWVMLESDWSYDYYIDYNEWINNEDGGELIIPNCFYKATCKDNNDNVSAYSEQIEYIVGDNGCLFCGNGDKIKINNNSSNITPTKYSVSNYPNPFNPVTKIKYELPKDGKVNLVIYDMLGREVKTLVNNEFKQAGSYMIEFNGSQLASGIYFYKIQVANFVQVKRMVLIK
jgi:hypothetical protein